MTKLLVLLQVSSPDNGPGLLTRILHRQCSSVGFGRLSVLPLRSPRVAARLRLIPAGMASRSAAAVLAAACAALLQHSSASAVRSIVSASTGGSAASATLEITGDTPWVVAGSAGVPKSSVDEGDGIEPISFQLALRDVQLDWYRVLGHPPPGNRTSNPHLNLIYGDFSERLLMVAVMAYPLRHDDSDNVAATAVVAPPRRGYTGNLNKYCDAR